jgi:Tfp pilus assembly protein PilF
MTRIEQLKQFIADDPSDPFPVYGLALEYLHHQPLLAQEVFRELLTRFPDYLPTYYPAAHLFIELGRTSEGEDVFRRGIDLARAQGDRKTEGELKQAYELWLFERDGR